MIWEILVWIAPVLLAFGAWKAFLWNYDLLESAIKSDRLRLSLVLVLVILGLGLGIALTNVTYQFDATTRITGLPMPMLFHDEYGTYWGAISLAALIGNPLSGVILLLVPGSIRHFMRERKRSRTGAV